jgi:hypothetical protein
MRGAPKATVSCLAYFGNNQVERELGNYIQALTAIYNLTFRKRYNVPSYFKKQIRPVEAQNIYNSIVNKTLTAI